MDTWIDHRPAIRTLTSYSIAIATTALAVWARYLMDPYLDEECPFSLFYLSVLLTAWLAGSGPAYAAVALGTCAAAYFFIKPQSSLALDSVSEVVQLLIFVLVNSVAALLFDRMRRQRQIAEQRSRDNELLSNSLREADERKDEFLALLAHELRNPLAPIRSGLEMLDRDQHASPTVLRVRQVIARQTNHLVRLTNDLLDVSRFTRGKIELQAERLDLRDAVADAIEMTDSLFAERGHRFQRLIAESPVWVDGDRVRLAQLTANLLGNAAKFTPPGGRVVLELEQSGGSAVLSVRDNGIGFPPDQAENMLLPFRQINMSRTREYGGLGLGLAIVKTIAGLHQGELSATSDGPGLGSYFAVRLPTLPAEPGAEAPSDEMSTRSSAPRELQPPRDACDYRKRVLVVEDGADAADLLCELLEGEGYVVDLARDGVSAVQLAASQLPDVCVMDIGLPGMDGYEVARRIRRLDPHRSAKLIAVTGWGSDAARENSREAGFDVHLVKPIVFGELLAEISDPALEPSATHDPTPSDVMFEATAAG